jgi:hypothetical protein
MTNRIIGINLLVAAGLASSFALAADPLQHASHSGLFKRGEADPKDHPLATVQKLEELVNRNSFKIRDVRNNDQFVFQVFATHPGNGAAALKDLGEDIADDGTTLVAAVDLTGSGVSDLIYARKDWGGWKVLSNGARLPKPFQGFLAGFCPKDADAPRSETIPADTRDMVVDNDLLTVVGDFLGNGTVQLAYTRPGWSQIWVVGGHGVVQMAADLQGIAPNGPGARQHWLFPFKSKGVHHTRIAYYRMGSSDLPTFAPRGMAFKREQIPLKGNWEKLSQNVLDWPQPAPGKVEQKAEEISTGLAKAAGMDQ